MPRLKCLFENELAKSGRLKIKDTIDTNITKYKGEYPLITSSDRFPSIQYHASKRSRILQTQDP